MYQFEDVNGDGVISTPGDLQALHELNPDYFGGLNNSLEYKNCRLDIFFQFVKQEGRNYFYHVASPPGFMRNSPHRVLERWQQEGDVTDIQKFTQGSGEARTAYLTNRNNGDFIFGDASFIRLKNISFSYYIPSGNTLFQNARSMYRDKPVDIYKLLRLRPREQSSGLPPLRIIMAGVQLNL